MEKVLGKYVAVCAVLLCIHLHGYTVHGDERYQQKMKQMINDLSSITREPRYDWNETLPLTPGYECYINRTYDKPALGHELVFECDDVAPSEVEPTSVHRLRPADIDVIGAMGDSLTAANGAGACFLPEIYWEYRGLTFSHGGDESFERNPSLGNIIRKFNPNLKGYGVDKGQWDSDEAGMNVGVPGDNSKDVPYQAEWLVQKMKADPTIDFENDWKLITIFIGANDLCDYCKNVEKYSADNYVGHIHEALMTLHDNMPRTIVNVVGVIRVDQVDVLRGPICNVWHWVACSCAVFLTDDEYDNLMALTREYQTKLEESIMSGQYDDKPDFTVVLQPFLQNTTIPVNKKGEPDFSLFAPDCFHFSAKGHAISGMELWNNMMEPIGEKRTSWNTKVSNIACPSEEFPYIYTNLNTRPEFWDPTQSPVNAAQLATPSCLQLLFICVAAFLLKLPYFNIQ